MSFVDVGRFKIGDIVEVCNTSLEWDKWTLCKVTDIVRNRVHVTELETGKENYGGGWSTREYIRFPTKLSKALK